MKRSMRGLALALVLVMCLLPAPARAESLLASRMQAAYDAGRMIETAFSAQLGDGLSLFIPAETFGAVQQLLADARIIARWAKGEADAPVMELAVAIQDAELLTATLRPLESAIALETSLLPGKTLMMPFESLTTLTQSTPVTASIDDETMALLAEAGERYLGIAMAWAQENDGLLVMSDEPVPATDARSEAAGSMLLKVTGAQLKDLLVRLTTEFEKDEALQAALDRSLQASQQPGEEPEAAIASTAKELADGAKGLSPLPGTLTLSAYTDAEGGLVGLDLLMEPLFEGMPESAFAKYDRLEGDGTSAHAFQGRLGLEQGGMAATMINYSAEESHLEQKSATDLLVRGMAQTTGEEPINQITLTNAYQIEQGEGREQMTDVLELVVETLTPDGSAQAENATPISASISTQSVTNEETGDDFDSNIAISLQALGMEFASLGFATASKDYAPADTSGNEVIDLTTASAETQAALMQELQTGLGTALQNALPLLPPELLEMLMQSEEPAA